MFKYLGWILEQVEGEVCGTIENMDNWFDEKERSKRRRTRPTSVSIT